METYFISDTHFNHDKDFVYVPRGYNSVEEMNEAIIHNWNNVVTDEDEVYHLGDFFLGDEANINKILHRLKGRIHLIVGNHDTDSKIEFYKNTYKIVEVLFAKRIKIGKKTAMLSHYPMLTANYNSKPANIVYSIHGHIHSTDKFYNDIPYIYNCSCDNNKCTPVSGSKILEEIRNKLELERGNEKCSIVKLTEK